VGTQPDAATLEYLLTQYDIPVPAKLPYGITPRSDLLMNFDTIYDNYLKKYYFEEVAP
jgi:nitrogenase molybdenum-iron protein alpha/beta subunit